MKNLHRKLKAIGACPEAVEWSKDYASLHDAWMVCQRPDWMLWLCGVMQEKEGWPCRQDIVTVACDCAILVLPIYEKEYPKDKTIQECIFITRAWIKGEATIEEVRAAANAAYAAYAAAAAAADNAANAAYAAAAANAAYAAAAAANAAADNAANAANAAAAAAAANAAYAAEEDMQKKCADICRKKLSIPKEIQ